MVGQIKKFVIIYLIWFYINLLRKMRLTSFEIEIVSAGYSVLPWSKFAQDRQLVTFLFFLIWNLDERWMFVYLILYRLLALSKQFTQLLWSNDADCKTIYMCSLIHVKSNFSNKDLIQLLNTTLEIRTF